MTTTTERIQETNTPVKPSKRPLELSLRLAKYMLTQKLKGRKRFPMVTMLEPLEMCNLSCVGCGRIREYKAMMSKMMPVDEAIAAVEESGAPIVSIAGGEPTIHPQISDIINELIRRKYFIYCCSNGLLMERVMKKIQPSKYFCWVVHMDGMEEKHDESVDRKGVFKKAKAAIASALNQGYRVCTNTTIFRGSDVEDLHELFRTMTAMGVEGCMISPGFDYEAVPDREQFLRRTEAEKVFREILDPDRSDGIRFYNNPLYLNFLRGERNYQCTAWSNPTYTIMGWRLPCYPLADKHVGKMSEIMKPEVWEKYGVGKDPRCANCMMHCGFESATIFGAVTSPKDWVTLIRSGAISKSGITAA